MAFPTVVRRATAVGPTSNGTTWTPTWTFGTNTAIAAGEVVRWTVFISADGNPLLTESGGNGWTKHANNTESSGAVAGAVFSKETSTAFAAGAAPAFVLDSGAQSEQFSATLKAEKVAAGKTSAIIVAAFAQGSSTNSNPPAVTNGSGASIDANVTCTRHGDSTVQATAAPTTPGSYTNLTTATGGGTNGASTAMAERQVTLANGASEDPGTFTSATEQWVSYTVAVYEVTSTTLTASNLATGSPALASPTLGQVHGLTAAATATGSPSLGSPALGQVHAMQSGGDLGLGPELVSNGTFDADLTDWGFVALNTDATVVANAARMQKKAAAAAAMWQLSPPLPTSLTVGKAYRLAATLTGALALVSVYTNAPAAAASLTTPGGTVDFTAQSQDAGYLELDLEFVGGAAAAVGTVGTFDNVSLRQLLVGTVTSSPAVGAPALTQTHVLTAAGSTTSSPALGTPTLGLSHVLSAAALTTSAPVMGAPAVGQAHSLAATPLVTASPALAAPDLHVTHFLAATSLATSAPQLGQPAVGQVHGLSGANAATASPDATQPIIGQAHALTATGIATGSPVLGTPSMSGAADLVADPLATGPPVVGTPTLGQVHALVASDLVTAAPELGQPVLGVTFHLQATDLATGAPSAGQPPLGQVHQLAANGVTTSAPVLGTPNMTGATDLTALDLVMSAPVVGAPVLRQVFVLTASGLASGPPVTGTPSVRVYTGVKAPADRVVFGDKAARVATGPRREVRLVTGGKPRVA